MSLGIILSLFLTIGGVQDFPMEYKMSFKANATFGPEYQVKHLVLAEDSTYTYHYYQSISKKQYLQSNYDTQKTEKGTWSVNEGKLVLNPEEGSSWQLILGRNWNLYFMRPDDTKGSKFKKKR